jgi:O-antigen/teichoic acid export membrane protein
MRRNGQPTRDFTPQRDVLKFGIESPPGSTGVETSRLAARKHMWGALWNSPTTMTWGSILTRSLTFLLVVPLVLSRFSTGDVALWYVFAAVSALQLQVDIGFSPTFARVIAFALGGLDDTRIRDLRTTTPGAPGSPNWHTIARICATMRVVYRRLALAAAALLIVVGTLVVSRPIALSSSPSTAWVAWAALVAASLVVLYGNQYSAYLQGLNQVALVRRWESLTNIGSIGSSFVVLLFGGGLVHLVVTQQAWLVLNVARNWLLARGVAEGRFADFKEREVYRPIFDAVWPSAWRSGIGTLAGQAPLQFAGLFYAQFGAPHRVAAYMLAIHVLTAIRTFAGAPFYSKIPLLARLRAEGDTVQMVGVAARGMRLSYWSFVVALLFTGALAIPLVSMIGSSVQFVPLPLWAVLGVAAGIERFGALHLQLYSTTNHIVWHTSNGITAIIFVVLALALAPAFDWYGFAIAYLVANLLFYAPYNASLSYKALGVRPTVFERTILLFPFIVLLTFAVVVFLVSV